MSRHDFEISKETGQQYSAHDTVSHEVSTWSGVTLHQHRFGGVEFRLGSRELGHLHPRFADLPLPRLIRDEVVASGRAKPHHVVPDSGWVTVPMRTASEAENVIGLLRQNYERAANTANELNLHETIEAKGEKKE
jgi:hypothetical protein